MIREYPFSVPGGTVSVTGAAVAVWRFATVAEQRYVSANCDTTTTCRRSAAFNNGGSIPWTAVRGSRLKSLRNFNSRRRVVCPPDARPILPG